MSPTATLSVQSVVVVGPSKTPTERMTLGLLALRLRSRGYDVASPLEDDRTDRHSAAHAREIAEAVYASDAVVMTPGWEDCDHAVAAQVQAEALGLRVFA